MAITIQLPTDLEKKLRAETPDLDTEARTAYALDLFRRSRLTHAELSQALGLDRVEVDALLKRQGIFENSLTSDEIDSDGQSLERAVKRGR